MPLRSTPRRLRRMRSRWRLASPMLRVTTQVGVALVLAAAAFAFLTSERAVDETAASVLVAVVFGVATVLQLRQSQRRQHTVQLISTFQNSPVLADADAWMASRIATGCPIPTHPSGEDDRHIVAVLDFYEFLASLALRGLIDVPVLLHLRGGPMSRTMRLCRDYVEARRDTVDEGLYRGLEDLVIEYERRRRRRVTVAAVPPPVAPPDAVAPATGSAG